MSIGVQKASVGSNVWMRSAGLQLLMQPLTLAILLQAIISAEQLDLAWASWLYAEEGYGWALKDSWLFSDLIHKGGRDLSIALLLGIAFLFMLSWWRPALAGRRRVLGYLVVAPAVASLLVALGKQMTGIECPWSLQPFGGTQVYVPLVQQLLQGGGEGGCFPAGHASAGYAWLALYFAVRKEAPRWRFAALAPGLGAGLLFGLSQQLRGAHFLSHDLWSLVLCWYAVMLLAKLMLPERSE